MCWWSLAAVAVAAMFAYAEAAGAVAEDWSTPAVKPSQRQATALLSAAAGPVARLI